MKEAKQRMGGETRRERQLEGARKEVFCTTYVGWVKVGVVNEGRK